MTLNLRALSTLALSCSFALLWGQVHWGMTSSGGASGIGSIYTISETGTFTKRHDLARVDGGTPHGQLVKWTNGSYYGVASHGGMNGLGLIFSFDPNTGAYTPRAHFSGGANGSTPVGGLTLANNGRLYGVCSGGGTNGFGTLYEFDPATNAITLRIHFNGTNNGREPYCTMVSDNNGRLWGTTFQGGANGTGTVFQYDPSNNTLSRRYSFGAIAANTTGRSPRFGLMKATGGRLFGVAQAGGANNVGTVYEIGVASPYTYTVVQTLSAATGGRPSYGGLVQGPVANVLYGTTIEGGTNNTGTIYRLDATTTTATLSKVHDIAQAQFHNLRSRLTLGSDGQLYGVSGSGSTAGQGAVFRFDPATNTVTALASLSANGLIGGSGPLLEDGTSWIGITDLGGAAGNGSMFRYTPGSSVLAQLVPFGLSSGASPHGKLLAASNGLYYGLAFTGGANGFGALFSFDPNTNGYTLLRALTAADGKYPEGTLLEVNGKLYGLCAYGGANEGGTIFEFDPASGVFTKKLDLSSSTTGINPRGGFTLAANGNLYTTMRSGGANGVGTLVRYVPGATTITKVHDFQSTTTGSYPHGRLLRASNGLIYGTTVDDGPYAYGTLFSLNTTNHALNVVYAFDGLQGGNPMGGLMQASNGKLYGMGNDKGLYDFGSIYSWDIATGTYNQEYDMVAAEGKHSSADLLQGDDGLLYGVCKEGGPNVEMGTIFRYSPIAGTYVRLRTFDLTAGYFPYDGFIRQNTNTVATQVQLAVKVFLEGPYVQATGRMNDALRSLAGFPLQEPFTADGLVLVGAGASTIQPSVLAVTGDNAIVDWVLLELRSAANPATVVRSRPALLQRDGDVVALNGTGAVEFDVPSGGSYHVAIRHRNHLGAMTSAALVLNSGTPLAVDFTSSATATYGTDARKTVGSARVLWAGNSVLDNVLRYTGGGNDRDPVLSRVGGSVPTATVSGYFREDLNLDGVVRYTGSSNDRDPILSNVGGSVPTGTRVQQLP